MSFFVSDNLKDLIDEDTFLNKEDIQGVLRLVIQSEGVSFEMSSIEIEKETMICEVNITQNVNQLKMLINQNTNFEVYCGNTCLKHVSGSIDLKQIKVKDDNCIIAKIHIINNLEK